DTTVCLPAHGKPVGDAPDRREHGEIRCDLTRRRALRYPRRMRFPSLWLALALLAPPATARADARPEAADKESLAQQALERGATHFHQGRLEEARVEFELARSLLPEKAN